MKVITVQTSSGIAYIEVDDQAIREVNPMAPPGGGSTASNAAKATTLVTELDKVSVVIAEVCEAVRAKVTSALNASVPDELTLEFGVKLAGELGIPLVTKGTAEAAFTVNAKWSFPKKN